MTFKIKNPKKKWISIGGYRGYEQPVYAVAGASDTGTLEDSPSPSHLVNKELKDFKSFLEKKGIKSKIVITRSSNVFMAKRWIIPEKDKFHEAKKLTKDYLKKTKDKTEFIHDTD